MCIRKVLVSLCCVLLLGSNVYAEKYKLRLAHDQSSGHPYDLGAQKIAENVKKATNGDVTIAIYPSSQLGDTAEQIEGLRMGVIDISIAAFAHTAAFVKELDLFGAPFLFRDHDHFNAVFDGKVGEILDKAAKDRYQMRLMATFTSGYRLLFNGKKEINTVSDLKGLKIRVMGGEANSKTWAVFNALPVPMPYSEVYSALQAGVIDGAENEPVSILMNKFYEAAPYFAITKHLVLPMGVFMSEKSLNKLPENYQKIVKEEMVKAANWERSYIVEKNKSSIDEMVKKFAVKVTYPDQKELSSKAVSIQDGIASKLGLETLLAEIRATK